MNIFNYLNKVISLSVRHFSKTRASLMLCTFYLIAATQLTACNIAVKAGNKPDISALESTLKSGVSTEQEIIKALGTPTGTGREMLPFMDAPRDTWTYYYEESDFKDGRRLFLFVFLANGYYDGYMWFSSLPEFKANSSP